MQELRDRTKSFALRVVKIYTSLPKTTEAQVMGKQVLRSGKRCGKLSRSLPGTIGRRISIENGNRRTRVGRNTIVVRTPG